MHPVVFSFGDITIYSYGLMLGIALVAGWQVVLRVGRGELPEAVLGNAYFSGALGGAIGARLLYFAMHHELLRESGIGVLDLSAGGLSAYGGLLGGLIGAGAYLKWKRASLRLFLDAAAPALGLGAALARLGCYLFGCDFGVRLSEGAPAALRALGSYPPDSPAFVHHVDRYALASDAASSYPVHPVQLYEMLAGLCLFGFSLWLRTRRRFAGQVFLLTVAGYAGSRFMLEYLREPTELAPAIGFSDAQVISLIVVPLCAIAYSALRRAPDVAATRAAQP